MQRSARAPNEARHKSTLVSKIQRSILWQFIYGNARTVALSTICAMYTVLSAAFSCRFLTIPWSTFVSSLQKRSRVHSSLRLVMYERPDVFSKYCIHFNAYVRRAGLRLHRKVKPRLQWHHTCLLWLLSQFEELQKSNFALCLSSCPHSFITNLHCTDDMLVVALQWLFPTKAKVAIQFQCKDPKLFSTDVDEINIEQTAPVFQISKQSCTDRFEPIS